MKNVILHLNFFAILSELCFVFDFSLQKLNVPCFLGGMARGLLGRSNPIQLRQCRKDALKDADVVILAG